MKREEMHFHDGDDDHDFYMYTLLMVDVDGGHHWAVLEWRLSFLVAMEWWGADKSRQNNKTLK